MVSAGDNNNNNNTNENIMSHAFDLQCRHHHHRPQEENGSSIAVKAQIRIHELLANDCLMMETRLREGAKSLSPKEREDLEQDIKSTRHDLRELRSGIEAQTEFCVLHWLSVGAADSGPLKHYSDEFSNDEKAKLIEWFGSNYCFLMKLIDMGDARRLKSLATFFRDVRHDDYRAIMIFRFERQVQERALGLNHLEVAATCATIGELFYRNRNYDEALANYGRALEIREAILGKGHVETAASYVDVGAVLLQLNRRDEALMRLCYALTVYQTALGGDNQITLGLSRWIAFETMGGQETGGAPCA